MNLVITLACGFGIGQALAQHFLGAGHDVWGLARRPQPVQSRFYSSKCDVASWESIERVADEISRQWSHVDGLVCCAGTQGVIGPAMTSAPKDWDATVHGNLSGTYFTIRAFFETLRRSPRRAKLICFSGGGATAPRPNFSAYGSAKAGLVRLVETLAVEWQDLPIDINAVAPGAIKTAMTEQTLAAGAAAGEKELVAARKQLEEGGQSMAKVIGLVEFLVSAESDGLRGKLISAQWDDWKTFAARHDELVKSEIYTLRRVTENRKS